MDLARAGARNFMERICPRNETANPKGPPAHVNLVARGQFLRKSKPLIIAPDAPVPKNTRKNISRCGVGMISSARREYEAWRRSGSPKAIRRDSKL